MSMYINLFLTFIKIGFVSFGGGYAMIPVIEYEVHAHGWMTTQEFTDVVAIAGMSPGPIATNSAVFVGYHVGGIEGAVISLIAVSLPSLIIVLAIALFMAKASKQTLMSHAFYGLRPVIASLIFYAAIRLAIQNGIIGVGKYWWNLDWIGTGIIAAALTALLFTKINPAILILLSGVIGILLYY